MRQISFLSSLVIIFALSIFLMSCGGPSMFVLDIPELNHTVYRLVNLDTHLTSKGAGNFGSLSFGVDMSVSNITNDTSFYFVASTLLEKPIPFGSGTTLELEIDGNQIILFGDCGPETRDTVKMGTKYTTSYYILDGGSYRIDRTIMKALANAKSVNFKVDGVENDYSGMLTANSLGKIQTYYNKYVR